EGVGAVDAELLHAVPREVDALVADARRKVRLFGPADAAGCGPGRKRGEHARRLRRWSLGDQGTLARGREGGKPERGSPEELSAVDPFVHGALLYRAARRRPRRWCPRYGRRRPPAIDASCDLSDRFGWNPTAELARLGLSFFSSSAG